MRLQMRTNEAKTALGPALHIDRVTWHTMTLFAMGWELERQGEGGGSELVCMKRKDSSLQMGKKGN